jgi:hypothetical protein
MPESRAPNKEPRTPSPDPTLGRPALKTRPPPLLTPLCPSRHLLHLHLQLVGGKPGRANTGGRATARAKTSGFGGKTPAKKPRLRARQPRLHAKGQGPGQKPCTCHACARRVGRKDAHGCRNVLMRRGVLAVHHASCHNKPFDQGKAAARTPTARSANSASQQPASQPAGGGSSKQTTVGSRWKGRPFQKRGLPIRTRRGP